MMFYASISSISANNRYKCNNRDFYKSTHNAASDVDSDRSLLTAASQRSSSYKKYRRAKPLDEHRSNTVTCNNNSNPQRLDHCSSRSSGNSITALSPAAASTTATTPSEDCVDSCSNLPRRRRHASLSAGYSSAASSSVAGLTVGRALNLSICVLMLLRLAPTIHGLAVGVDTANANITDLGSPGLTMTLVPEHCKAANVDARSFVPLQHIFSRNMS